MGGKVSFFGRLDMDLSIGLTGVGTRLYRLWLWGTNRNFLDRLGGR